MKKLAAAIYAGILFLLVSQLALGAGFFPLQPNPGGGYPTSPTFVHVGTGALNATDNVTSDKGIYTSILRRGGYDVYTRNDNAAIAAGVGPLLDNSSLAGKVDAAHGEPFRARSYVDASLYGFRTDNTALNKAALTAAVAAAAPLKKPVYISPGHYYVDNTSTGVHLLDNTIIIGVGGRDAVTIEVQGGPGGVQKIFESYPDNSKVSHIYISGITFIGTKPPAVASGGSFSNMALYFGYVSNLTFEWCRFKYFGTQVHINGNAAVTVSYDAEDIHGRFNEHISDNTYTPGVGIQYYSGRDGDFSFNLFDYISRPLSMELSTDPYIAEGTNILFNKFRHGKTADLSATNTYGGITLSADVPGKIKSTKLVGNDFWMTNTDNNINGYNITVHRAGTTATTLLGNTHRNYNQWGETFNDAIGVTSTGDTFACDNSSLYTCRGMLLQGLLQHVNVNSPVFNGQMNIDLTTGLTAGHKNITVANVTPSGSGADGAVLGDILNDQVTWIGPYGTDSQPIRFTNDNTQTFLWSGLPLIVRTKNAAGNFSPKMTLSSGTDNATLTMNNNTMILDPQDTAAPTCSSALRGATYLIQGGAGVADNVVKCVKNAANNYVWQSLY